MFNIKAMQVILHLSTAHQRPQLLAKRVRWPLPRRYPAIAPRSAAMDKIPGVCSNPDPSTKDFIMQQTMLRIKDPQASLDFYTRVLGMRLLHKFDFAEMSFSLYFVGYCDPSHIPTDNAERIRFLCRQPGTIELTHNYGTESDPSFAGYHNGNTDPRGFGHIGIVVPDVEAACTRFEELGVDFVKRPNDGKMKGLAFIKDPDGYWIEVLEADNMARLA